MNLYNILIAKKISGGGGGGGSTLINKNISANGTYNATDDSADGYKKVVVSVPNTYSAGDEGKVVSSGALVSQSSATYTSNNTYDTTLINSVTVNVGGNDDPEDFTGGNILAITSHGTEYILTDYQGSLEGVFGTKMSDSNVNSHEGYWCLYRASSYASRIKRNGTQQSLSIGIGTGTLNIGMDGYSSGNIITPVFYTIGFADVVADRPLIIFGNYYNNAIESTKATYTFYGLNILDADFKYVARFMPWLDNGEACVKDLISGKIYKNSGTGAFDYIDLQGVVHNA